MRVAAIGQRGVPATFGGVEHHVEELGARLAARGHHVTVFCRTNYVSDPVMSYRGMTLRHLPTVGTKHLDAIVHTGLSTVSALRGFDIVHYHALGPGAVAPLARYLSPAKVVQTVHGLDYERAKWGRGARAFLQGSAWLSARVPDATIVVSQALADHYRLRYGREVTFIPNGVDDPLGPLPPAEITSRFGLSPGRYLLFVGRLVPEKAPDLLVKAFRALPGDVRLVLVGDSSFTDGYSRLVRQAAEGDPRILFTGYLHGAVLGELYAHARAFVLPSALEGLPLALLEAVSYGTPVVASAIPAHLEVLGHDGPGRRLFRCGDQHDLTRVLALATDDARAEGEVAGAARLRDEVVPRYRWDHVTDAVESLYRTLLHGRPPGRPQRPATPL